MSLNNLYSENGSPKNKKELITQWSNRHDRYLKFTSYGYCKRLGLDGIYAEDYAGDTWKKICKKSFTELLKYNDNPMPFLVTVLKEIIVKGLQDKKKRTKLSNSVGIDFLLDDKKTYQNYQDKEQSERRYEKLLNKLNRKLTPDQLKYLLLRADGKSHAEIAREMNKNSEEAVRTSLHRVRKIAQEVLRK